jgi:mercuric reductase
MTNATFKSGASVRHILGMAVNEYELVILGQGSAAFAAAIKADDLGIKTAMIGRNVTDGTLLGGTCVNVGCVPSKRLITVATLFHTASHNSFEGISYDRGRPDFKRVMRQKDALVRRFRRDKYRKVLNRLKHVKFYEGLGRFTSKTTVRVENVAIRSRRFIVATGARASVPASPGLDRVDYLTNEEALSLKKLPESLCVIGGRALGLEFAQMYAQLGSRVTVLQRSGRILPEHEPVVSKALRDYLEKSGITVWTGVNIGSIRQIAKNKIINYTSHGKRSTVKSEEVLFATGRRANTEGLDLPIAGVETDSKGFVKVNPRMETSSNNAWAAGDVTGEPMLETVAAKEGSIAVENAFSKNRERRMNFDEVPSAVFTYPEVARVGLTEAQAHERGIRCSCTTLPFDLVPKAQVIGDVRGLVKMVIDAETKRVLGVHIVAPNAADMIHEAVLAVKFKLTIDNLIDTVHVFPTLSESLKLTAQSFYRDVGNLSCCTE